MLISTRFNLGLYWIIVAWFTPGSVYRGKQCVEVEYNDAITTYVSTIKRDQFITPKYGKIWPTVAYLQDVDPAHAFMGQITLQDDMMVTESF
ncbi:hypothetical protein FRC19_007535 [Serendipita sp. 401]|nr:hypothetical protein FRC16_005705 [Serendipita sp. 398]KAG8805983.1 hypothetical protein FRC19_007535 [Serendipita sp. 401]KAG9028383.1 hypothetical protein FS842_004767 [Serendipita sp. 407]